MPAPSFHCAERRKEEQLERPDTEFVNAALTGEEQWVEGGFSLDSEAEGRSVCFVSFRSVPY